MKASELIRLVFNGAAGTVVAFDLETNKDFEIDLEHLNDLPDAFGIEMVLDGYAYGIHTDDRDLAVFSTCYEDGETLVALLEDPVPVEELRDDERTDVPLCGIVVPHPENFYTLEELRGSAQRDQETAEEDGGAAGAAEPVGAAGSSEPLLQPDGHVPVQSGGSDGAAGATEPAEAEVSGAAEASGDADDYYGEWNDAALIGPEPEGYMDFLHKDATFLIGEMWGAKDRRNTQDGDWKAVTMPWGRWIEGAPGNKNQPAFGFSRHPEGKYKEGASIVLGSSIEGARKANAMDEMFALGLDIDSGAQLPDVEAKIRELGLLALIYTSHSHGKSGLEIKRDEVMRKLGISEEPTLPQVQEFLRMHSKSRYEESFITQVRIADPKKQTKEGVKIALSTPPLDKFRIIFPLAEAVKLIDLAPTQAAALEVWEDKITGMAWEALGVHFDTSCTDPSRLFYTARHAKESEWDCMIIRGEPLRFEDVPVYKKHQYTKHRSKLNPFEMAGDGIEEGRAPAAFTPSSKGLNDWHHHAKDRFQIATLLEDLCQDKIRVAGGEAPGHVHIECPFEHEHSKEGGTGTMAIDAIDAQTEYWTVFCKHDSCQGRHKLQFLEEMLAQGWFEEDILFDEDGLYLLPPGEEDAPKEPPKDETTGEVVTIEDRAAAFDRSSKGADIEAFLKDLFEEGIDIADRNRVTDILVGNTVLGKRDVNKMWQALDKVQRKIDADKARAGDVENSGVMMTDADFDKQIQFAGRRIMDTNQDAPFLFQYVQDKAEVREAADGIPFIEFVDRGRFGYHMNNVAPFYQPMGDSGKRRTNAPEPVVKHLFETPNNLYPPLKGITNTPVFASNGKVISEAGYDLDSNLYYHPAAGVVVPPVSDAPTDEEVWEAKRLLIEELLGDFPIAAKTRKELIAEGLHGDGVPALTNLIAFFLLPFVRELLNNGAVAPGMLITKPAPGSGASLLVDCYSIVTSGRTASPFAIPKNEEEMAKTLSSVLIEARAQMYFDNINNNVDSGELASAMTADHYSARVLGKSATVDVPVRSTFIFTGNNVMMSGELVRRLILIDLDTRLANPELRTGWHHSDIKAWATENRGELVWACLTLVANWVANGRPEQHDAVLASYEDFCRKVGGILECAGIGGFLGNRDELKEKALDESDDEFDNLIEVWWEHCGTRPIFSKGKEEKDQGLCELAMGHEVSLPIRKERDNVGDLAYSSKGMGKLLSQYKNRIFVLEDGSEVTLRRDSKKTKRGYAYFLELNQKAPQSNV